ncbi:MAG: pseudouridine synthase [Gammaproteobacteria bacterium]|nr:pseudouridine synthase [Gammaproteobacteria bacterium]MCY4312884.1 pseudouridine synthase [Gammaproteobacteria bacterium]
MPDGASTERLQKYLSRIGVGSRRRIDSWIADGRITVDGKIATPGIRVTSGNRIRIDGSPIRGRISRTDKSSRPRVILYNKPEGEICTRNDPQGRPSVFRNFPKIKQGRWVTVGRLDINTRGLLLVTDDGDLAQALMHPSSNIEREYLCRVYGNISASKIDLLLKGRKIDGRKAKFLRVKRIRGEGRNTWYSAVVGEGRYREVRRLWESVGCTVSRLNRIRYGDIQLPRNLRVGNWVELDRKKVARLKDSLKQENVSTGSRHRKRVADSPL